MAITGLLLLAKLGMGFLDAEGKRKEGSAAKDKLFGKAEEIRLRAEDKTAEALEQQESIDIAAREAVATTRTKAGKSGVRVAGSVIAATDKIKGKAARQKELVASRASRTVDRLNRQSDRLRSQGLSAKAEAKRAGKLGILDAGLDGVAGVHKAGTLGGTKDFDWARILA